ncbi:HK97 family phage prohead protease [Aureimonas flava]|uniref:HK97 family phage prohead protease n=2 Tax=Aureimonas flava TaxID=2320271 RepID=A0A3A1WLQ7_9HYPH|nr:HK97 family phage prohead protease [Aureimonas flava]RIY01286.1 HK97 family phage prohead protease [Aureimonas flava]
MPLAAVAEDDEPGLIRGYASLFDRTDRAGDRILRGAFARSLEERTASGVRMLWQHDPAEPIGRWTVLREDARGLYAEGRLELGSRRGREALALLRGGAIDGLSIGFRTRRSKPLRDAARRLLTDIDLWEISLVTFPMQEAARVREVRGLALGWARALREAARRIAPRGLPVGT